MVHRVSLGSLVPKDTPDKNRRRSASARLNTDPKYSRTFGTEPCNEKGSSLETPFVIDSDDEKTEKTTPHSRSGPKTSPKAFKARFGVELSANLDQNNLLMPSSTANPGHRDQTLANKCESSLSTGPQKLQAFCGMSYVKPGNLRNHQDGCPKCKAIQGAEDRPANEQKELPDRVKQLNSSTRRTSGANGLLDSNFHVDDMSRSNSKTNDNHKEFFRANNSNTTQLVSWELSMLAKTDISPSDKKGYVYIFRDPKTGYLKIGYTKDPKKRANQHEKCGLNLDLIHISRPITWMKRAEKLILCDLQHLSKPWYCSPCRQLHKEYFEVTVERAKATVDRWVEWINRCDIYQSDKSITSFWNYLISDGRSPTKEIEPHDHEARWARWDWVLSEPSESDVKNFESYTEQQETGRKEEKTAKNQCLGDGARYISRESLNVTDGNDFMDLGTAEILDKAAVALAEKLRGNKDCMKMEVTFRAESSSGDALVYSVHWLSQ